MNKLFTLSQTEPIQSKLNRPTITAAQKKVGKERGGMVEMEGRREGEREKRREKW